MPIHTTKPYDPRPAYWVIVNPSHKKQMTNIVTDDELDEIQDLIVRAKHLILQNKCPETLSIAASTLYLCATLWPYMKHSSHRTATSNALRSLRAVVENLMP